MSAHTDNPYAFPGDSSEQSHDGMRLRDYFAAHALQALIIRGQAKIGMDQPMPEEQWVSSAYYIADKMLQRRSK